MNNTYLEGPGTVTQAVDRMDQYLEMAEKKFQELKGVVTRTDIQVAMLDRDQFGNPTTSATIIEDYVDPSTMEVIKEVSRLSTAGAVIDIQRTFTKKKGYCTMTFKFSTPTDPDRISLMKVLEGYFKEETQLDGVKAAMEGVPNLSVVCVPLTLAGKYGVLARDPICVWPELDDDYGLQQSSLVKIMFESCDVEFLRNPDFDAREAVREIRSELISQTWDSQSAAVRKREREEYEALMSGKIAESREINARKAHSFNVVGLGQHGRMVKPEDRR